MALSKKTIFSISLVLAGVIFGLIILLAYSMSGGKTSISLVFFSLAVVSIITGTILAFSRLLDKVAAPVMDEISGDLKDDIQEVKALRMTNTLRMVIIAGISFLVFSYFIFRFHKMEAMWGFIPVVIPTFVGLILLAWFIPRTQWFRESNSYTPMWIFLIPTIRFIITLGVGLTRTENMKILNAGPHELVQYNTIRVAGSIIEDTGSVGNFALNLDLPKCDGNECAVLLVIGLVILVFVLVIGSATIPHFWLMSGSILLGIMLLITLHDLRIRPPAKDISREDTNFREKSTNSAPSGGKNEQV